MTCKNSTTAFVQSLDASGRNFLRIALATEKTRKELAQALSIGSTPLSLVRLKLEVAVIRQKIARAKSGEELADLKNEKELGL